MKQNGKFTVNGLNLYVITRGKGVPVILLGGPWLGQRYLQPMAEQLSADFQITAYDPRGSGHSDVNSIDEINLTGHLADLEGLRKKLNADRINLIGHSLGALICLAYAISHPEHTGALVLANPGPPMVPEMLEMLHTGFMAELTAEELHTLEKIQSTPGFMAKDSRAHEMYFKVLYGAFFKNRGGNRVAIERLDFGFTETTAKYALGAEEMLVHELLMLDLVGNLARVASPTLVIHSEEDLIPEAFSQLLAKGIPVAEFAHLKGVGHFAYLEDPDLFYQPVVNFLHANGI